jgi:hypothetical protein
MWSSRAEDEEQGGKQRGGRWKVGQKRSSRVIEDRAETFTAFGWKRSRRPYESSVVSVRGRGAD